MRLPKVHYCRIAGKKGFCVYWNESKKQRRMQVPIEDEALIKQFCAQEETNLQREILGIVPRVPVGKATIGEVIERYFKEEMYYPERAENTVEDRRDRCNKVKAYFGARNPIASITPEAIAAWKKKRLHEVSKTTVSNDLRALRALLGYAVSKKLYNGPITVQLPKGESHRGQIIPRDHALALFRGLDLADRHERAYYIALVTGLRGTDIARLAPEHFDREGHLITIVTQKRGRRVRLPLPTAIWSRIEPFIGENPFCLYPSTGRAKTFTQRLCGASYGPRICRPTWASAMAEGGADFLVVKTLMGHKVADITAGYITHDIERVRGEYEKLPWLKEKYLQVITCGA